MITASPPSPSPQTLFLDRPFLHSSSHPVTSYHPLVYGSEIPLPDLENLVLEKFPDLENLVCLGRFHVCSASIQKEQMSQ